MNSRLGGLGLSLPPVLLSQQSLRSLDLSPGIASLRCCLIRDRQRSQPMHLRYVDAVRPAFKLLKRNFHLCGARARCSDRGRRDIAIRPISSTPARPYLTASGLAARCALAGGRSSVLPFPSLSTLPYHSCLTLPALRLSVGRYLTSPPRSLLPLLLRLPGGVCRQLRVSGSVRQGRDGQERQIIRACRCPASGDQHALQLHQHAASLIPHLRLCRLASRSLTYARRLQRQNNLRLRYRRELHAEGGRARRGGWDQLADMVKSAARVGVGIIWQ